MEGLSYVPDLGDDNSLQLYKDKFTAIANKVSPVDYYSFKNRTVLFNCLKELRLQLPFYLPSGHPIGYYPMNILEIGIGRRERFLNTSTAILIGFKHSTVRYIGIDAENRNYLGELSNPNLLIFTDLSTNILDSWERDTELLNAEIDLLHIDGGHSLNNILTDWQFSKYVKKNGIIAIHDIKAHPGPIELVKAIDRDIYTVHKLFNDDPKDFGMAIVYRKENDYGKVVQV